MVAGRNDSWLWEIPSEKHKNLLKRGNMTYTETKSKCQAGRSDCLSIGKPWSHAVSLFTLTPWKIFKCLHLFQVPMAHHPLLCILYLFIPHSLLSSSFTPSIALSRVRFRRLVVGLTTSLIPAQPQRYRHALKYHVDEKHELVARKF